MNKYCIIIFFILSNFYVFSQDKQKTKDLFFVYDLSLDFESVKRELILGYYEKGNFIIQYKGKKNIMKSDTILNFLLLNCSQIKIDLQKYCYSKDDEFLDVVTHSSIKKFYFSYDETSFIIKLNDDKLRCNTQLVKPTKLISDFFDLLDSEVNIFTISNTH